MLNTLERFVHLKILLISTLLCAILLIVLLPQQAYAQADTPDNQVLLVVPVESSPVSLHTHTADFQLSVAEGNLTLQLDAFYRLKNPGITPVNLPLQLVSKQATPLTVLPPGLELTIDDQPTGLLFTDDLGYTLQVPLGGDARVELRLRYTVVLTATPLVTLGYDPAPLQAWYGGEPSSLRVSFALPAALTRTSWLQVAPTGWRFLQSETTQEPLLRWLYDSQLPGEPFVFQFIHPAIWQQIQQTQAATTAGAPTSNYITLGDLYRQLQVATTGTLQDRFYAQALAAYSAGLTNADAINAPAAERAPLQVGLATLYRQRAIGADGTVNPSYMELMTQAAMAAAAALPADAPQHQELLQWQVEGLTLALNAARDRRDWQQAFQTLDQLAALPPDAINPAMLEESRRAILVQQALEFLEEGNQTAAQALAGPAIQADELLPPPNARALFTRWQVTMTIQPDGTELILVGSPTQAQQANAESAISTLVDRWQGSGLPVGFTVKWDKLIALAKDSSSSLQLDITVPTGASGQTLAQAIPAGADWALLRALLAQLSPQIDQDGGLLRQNIQISQPLEVRGVGEEWSAVAAALETEANQLEAQSPTLNLANSDASSAETALRVRIQAANYRHAAQQWRTLARTSLIRATLAAPIGLQTISRSWLATVETPTQILELQAEATSLGRLLGGALVTLLGLFMVTGVLWWLL